MNKPDDLKAYIKRITTPVEDDRTPTELIFDAVAETLDELDPYMEYTLADIVEINYPLLWHNVHSCKQDRLIERNFLNAVCAGRFSPLRCIMQGAKSNLYRLDD